MATLEFTTPVAQVSPLKNQDANQTCTVRLQGEALAGTWTGLLATTTVAGVGGDADQKLAIGSFVTFAGHVGTYTVTGNITADTFDFLPALTLAVTAEQARGITEVDPPTAPGQYKIISFTISGPSSSSAVLAPGPDNLETSFVIDVPGRYLVRLATEGHDGNAVVAETFSALVEVRDAQVPPHPDYPTASGSIPAPNESNEFDANDGWARSSEAYLSLVSKSAGYKKIVSVTSDGVFGASAGNVIALDAANLLKQWKDSDVAAADGYNNYTLMATDLAQDGQLSTPTDTLALLLEPLAIGGKALALISGVVNYDTNTFGVGNTIYVDSVAGDITDNSGALLGVPPRKVGKVLKVGPDAVLEPGVIYFNGEGVLLGSVVGITPPGGADTQVQFNDGGAFGGSTLFYDKTTNPGTFGLNVAPAPNDLLFIEGKLNEGTICAFFNQLDTVNHPDAVAITNAGEGIGLNILQGGDGFALRIESGTLNNQVPTTFPVMYLTNHGTGQAILLSQNGDATALSVGNADPVGTKHCVEIFGIGTAASLHVVGAGVGPALKVDGGVIKNYTVPLAYPYDVQPFDYTVGCDPTAGSVVVNLPAASADLVGRILIIGDAAGTAVAVTNEIVVTPSLADTINRANAPVGIQTADAFMTLQCVSATGWMLISGT